jgi:hypothetical protein
MSGVRWTLGAGLAIGATVLLAALSRAPQRVGDGDGGLLRLSLSGQPERVEVCRAVAEEELRNLPQHMRQPVICEGRSADYRVRVTLGGAIVADERATGGGVRHDRPIYLYREFPLPPGTHTLTVRFDLADSTASSAPSALTAMTARIDALPRTLTLDTTLTLGPRAIALVTYDPEHGGLVIRTARSAGSPLR